MKITILVENKSDKEDLVAEGGFCAYIEDGEQRIIFDTAQHGGFIANAEKLGINLMEITHIVISHGHNDHAKGLLSLFSHEKYAKKLKEAGIKFVTHPKTLLKKRDLGRSENTVISCLHEYDLSQYFEMNLSDKPYKISENVFFLGQIPDNYEFEGDYFIGDVLIDGEWELDYMLEDSALAIKTDDGLVIVSGCSHRGICNIVSYAKKVTGEDRIADIVGGLHLGSATQELIAETARNLSALGVDTIHACHCTGDRAIGQLSETFKSYKTLTGSVLTY